MGKSTSIAQYWYVYGGFWSLTRSTYFGLAVVSVLVGLDSWWIKVCGEVPVWREFAIAVIPSVLGFALGGMAIMLAFSTDRFLFAIKQGGKDDSYFMKVVASFFHLTIVLVTCMFCALFLDPKIVPRILAIAISGIGFFTLSYGMLLIISTAAALWHTARIFNRIDTAQRDPTNNGG